MRDVLGVVLYLFLTSVAFAQTAATLRVEVRHDGKPIADAEVRVNGVAHKTDAQGVATISAPSGIAEIVAVKEGFAPATASLELQPGQEQPLIIDLSAEPTVEEHVTVSATRTGKRIEDEPLRVEVLDHEEIEEKTLMTPGDIAMLLNETSGLRVQVTAPSLGAANVRVQGLRGRYTQILADGLPLYGGQTGAIGLLQIPPMDLGQVEVIKGVASALYGASALGGVINLVSRRPEEREREFLLNRTTRNGTDGVLWLAGPMKERWGYSFLGGGHFQERTDLDDDGWADLPGYRRGIVRPRVFWDTGAGRSLFATIGVMAEDRQGGTIGASTVPDGSQFPEELTTRRFDTGLVGRFLVGSRVVSVRASAMTQRHRHQFGDAMERDRHDTWFGEAAVSGTTAGHTWVVGSAVQGDRYHSRDVPRFDYTYTVPGLFAQDEFTPAPWVTLSASGRLDVHNEFGPSFNPRVSALLRLPRRWVLRASTGTGFFAPTPFTEETEAVGLSRVLALGDLETERAWSASLDLGWSSSHLEVNGSLFGSIIRDPVMLREPSSASGLLEIINAEGPTRTLGSELLARVHAGHFGLMVTHTYVHSTEVDADSARRGNVPLTPRHTAGVVGMWEDEARGRVGIEAFYTGRQWLDDNPYRAQSRPYVFFGILAERRFGRVRLFVNAENLGDVRQTRYDPLVRPQRHVDGRWTVDAWAPLEGRIVNGGIRVHF